MFKLQLLVKVIRLKFVNLFRENVVKVVGTFEVSLKVTFVGQLSKASSKYLKINRKYPFSLSTFRVSFQVTFTDHLKKK